MKQWGNLSAFDGILQVPAYVAVDNLGNTYVTDEVGHCVHKFDAQNNYVKSWGSKGKRLAKRFVDTRHHSTGISRDFYNSPEKPLGQDLTHHFVDPHTTYFPWPLFEQARGAYYPESIYGHRWIGWILAGKELGEPGREFVEWAREELAANAIQTHGSP